jgi:hypothetical protein
MHVENLHRIIAEHGSDPSQWLPVFMDACTEV